MNRPVTIVITVVLLWLLNGCYRTKPYNFHQNTQASWCNVSNVFNTICSRCHRPGGIGPFSLLTYEAVLQHKSTILTVLEKGIMPPWKADTSYTHFGGEYALGIAERQLVIDWIKNGAPKCDTAVPAKEYPPYNSLSQIGNPDTTLAFQHTYVIPENNDHYQYFVIPIPWNENRYATAIEIVPGNPQAVHHITASLVSDTAWADYLTTNKIWHYNIREEKEKSPVLLAGWAKGSFACRTPDSIGILLPKRGLITLQIHYSGGFKGERDSTRVNIFLNKQKPERQLRFEYANNFNINFAPNEIKYDQLVKHVDSAITITSIWPHTHYLARNVLCFALTPAHDTIRLIRINDWDYDWQNLFVYLNPVVVPAGSDIIMKCLFDNSNDNPRNPNNPPKRVVFGVKTSDEMLNLNYYYLNYKKGDEKIKAPL